MNPLLLAAGTSAITTGAGMAIDQMKQEQQLKQSKQLMQQQIEGNKELAYFNNALGIKTAKEMWEHTNYANQRKQMEKAGLNVGLMYGQGGGGGATTSAPAQSQSVSGQNAYVGENAGMGILAGTEMAMKAAQIKLMEAQAKKTEVEAEKIGGVDTEEAKTRIENLKQTTDNAEVQEKILEFEKQIKEVEANIGSETAEDVIRRMKTEADKLESEAITAKNEGKISEETYQEVIKQSKLTTQEMTVNLLMQKALLKQTGEQTKLTQEQQKNTQMLTQKYVAEMNRMAAQTNQGWEQLSQQEQQIVIQRTLQEFSTSDAAKMQQWTKVLQDVSGSVRNIGSIIPTK